MAIGFGSSGVSSKSTPVAGGASFTTRKAPTAITNGASGGIAPAPVQHTPVSNPEGTVYGEYIPPKPWERSAPVPSDEAWTTMPRQPNGKSLSSLSVGGGGSSLTPSSVGGGGTVSGAAPAVGGGGLLSGMGTLPLDSILQTALEQANKAGAIWDQGAQAFGQAKGLVDSMGTSVANGDFAREQAVAAQALRNAQGNLAGRFSGDTSSPAYAVASANLAAQEAAPAAARLAEIESGNMAAKLAALSSLAGMGMNAGGSGAGGASGLIGNILDYDLGLGKLGNDRYIADSQLSGQRYVADQNLAGNKYVADRGLEGDKYTSDNALSGQKYVADSNLAGSKYHDDSAERISGNELAGQKYVADTNAGTQRYVADSDLSGKKYVSDADLAGSKYHDDTAYNTAKYTTDAQSKTASEAALTSLLQNLGGYEMQKGRSIADLVSLLRGNGIGGPLSGSVGTQGALGFWI